MGIMKELFDASAPVVHNGARIDVLLSEDAQLSAEFDESKITRDADGKFGSGGGGAEPEKEPTKSKPSGGTNPKVEAWAAKRFKNPAHAKAFTEWFGDSKVVDENGEPLVVYHGTANFKGSKFDAGNLGTSTGAMSASQGFFFTTDSETAEAYADLAANIEVKKLLAKYERAERNQQWDKSQEFLVAAEKLDAQKHRGQSIMPTFISMKNPLIIDAKGASAGTGDVGITDWIADAKSGGHDGVIIRNLRDDPRGTVGRPADHFVAFASNQIKSSTGNRGTFDPDSDDITMSAQFAAEFDESKITRDAGGKFGSGGGGGKEPEKEPAKSKPSGGTNPTVEAWASKRFKNPAHAKAFTDAFGDTEALNDDGTPLLVHHVSTENFTVFDPDKAAMGGIIWFTSDKSKIESGETGAGLRPGKKRFVIDAHLSIKKMAGWDEYDKFGIGELKGMGYDGIKLDDDYVVFEPTQIKSATGNNGNFDMTNPDIEQ